MSGLRVVGRGDGVRGPHEAVVDLLDSAIRGNPRITGGLLARCAAFAFDEGPSGGPEALVLLGAEALPAVGFWYGHVVRHPARQTSYAALLYRSDKFVNAGDVTSLFTRQRYWTVERKCYSPCAVQSEGDAYAESPTFAGAAHALAGMVAGFDPVARGGLEGSGHEYDPCDFRLLDVYGLSDLAPLGAPAAKRLRVVPR